MAKLNVLVLESDPRRANRACAELTAAGHTVLRCHEPGAPAFPCNAFVAGRDCPLAAHTVDVALDVRSRGRAQPTGLEDGVRCALLKQIPLVVAGDCVLDPISDFATATIGVADVVSVAVERAATTPLKKHSDAAARALLGVIERRELSVTTLVGVYRRHGALSIEVRGCESLDARTKDIAAVRMLAAVRAVDKNATGVDVLFVD